MLAACTSGPDPANVFTSIIATVHRDRINVTSQSIDESIDTTQSPSAGEILDGVTIEVTLGDQRTVLQPRHSFPFYTGNLTLAAPLGSDVHLFATVEVGGETATIDGVIPPPFSASSPVEPHASQPIAVTWTPTSDHVMSWTANACANEFGRDEGPIRGDPGAIEFPAGLFASVDASPCDVELELLRVQSFEATTTDLGGAFLNIDRDESLAFTVTP